MALQTLPLSRVLKAELLSRLLAVSPVLRRSCCAEQAHRVLALPVSACLLWAAFQLCRSLQSTLGLRVVFVSPLWPSLATLGLVMPLQTTTWGRIVDGKCLGKLCWSRIPVASSIAVCLGRKEKVKCG